MATAELLLPIQGAVLTDDSSGSKMAQIERAVSSDATDPQAFWFRADFDAATEEHLLWQFRVPAHFKAAQPAGFPKLYVQAAMASATGGTVQFAAAVRSRTPGAGERLDNVAGFAAFNESAAVAVPDTAGKLFEVEIDLSGDLDGLAAGDLCLLCLKRDADDAANDTAAGDARVVAVSLRYAVDPTV
jgi:hypothetical protein